MSLEIDWMFKYDNNIFTAKLLILFFKILPVLGVEYHIDNVISTK